MENSSDNAEINHDFQQLCQASEEFANSYTDFKTTLNRIQHIGNNNKELQAKIVEHANETKVIIHYKVKSLIEEFLIHKRECGSKKERDLYQKLTTEDFVRRALLKRPLVFFGSNDVTILRNNESANSKNWTIVGTDEEQEITLEEYMTYDEISISAMIGVAVPTFFINPGGRYNAGDLVDDKQDYGIYVALTGARFEKKDKMESKHMLVTEQFHTAEQGYGSKADPNNPATKLLVVWARFYDEKNTPEPQTPNERVQERHFFLSYDEVDKRYRNNDAKITSKFHQHTTNTYGGGQVLYINILIYKQRIQYIVEPFLIEANNRGLKEAKKVYIHAVGLGLGVWQISNEQAKWMMEVYAETIQKNKLPWISDVDFSWFPDNSNCGGKIDGEDLDDGQRNKIKIHFSKRDPAEKLEGPNEGKLLVAMYAWDGNSFPGNEYWRGMLHASDPAAACCSTMAELQNPYINKKFHG